ncbi:alpha-glucosidase [Notoacmeibacter sp. MSK16QG-6]|uniref:alpha-glucosidase n=1 Tax=Notoacmeibacter sp. MSK16QG-6 TaxID=2957982 RepID=UPI003530E478
MSLESMADAQMTAPVMVRDPDWWRGAVIYQIYPRSFQDSNGDGIGDLAGITQRLPYVASLGVDAIWISPFFPSPMDDFGYDIAHYTDVDPMFGTLSDFDRLVSRAHELGLKVIIDQVISHSSDRHPWFMESRSGRDGAKADWYVWADPKEDGGPPNNWLSIFGGTAWEWDATRCQYYLHNFLTSQPDLNFHNPEVQDALLGTVRFWLERGVDGVRLDTINFYFHSADLQNNPALPPEDRNEITAPRVNPYNYQNHIYDKSRPENLAFLARFRALLEEFEDRAALGEVSDALRGLEIVGQYTSGTDGIHMCYSFEFLAPGPLTPRGVRKTVEEVEAAAPDGWSCWAFSNHDVARHASRYCDAVFEDRAAFLRVLATVLLTLRGSVSLYQGEELGFDEAEVPYEDLQDPYGIRFWPAFKGRDGSRTPMVWSHHAPHGGFSSARPWLPVANSHLDLSVTLQEEDSNSLLHFYRTLTAFRHTHPALAKGTIVFHQTDDRVLSYERSTEEETLFIAVNMSGENAPMTCPDGVWEPLALKPDDKPFDVTEKSLPPYGIYIAKRR